MSGRARSSLGDAAWQVGAYVAAALIHVPLIVAVQDLGGALAASTPQGPNITLVDLPAPERLAMATTAATGDVAFETTTALDGRAVASEAAETVTTDLDRLSPAAVVEPALQTTELRSPAPARTVSERQVAAQPDTPGGDPVSGRVTPVEADPLRSPTGDVAVAAAVENEFAASSSFESSPQVPAIETTARPSPSAAGDRLAAAAPERPVAPASDTSVAARRVEGVAALPAAGGAPASLAATAVPETGIGMSAAIATVAPKAATGTASRPVADVELAPLPQADRLGSVPAALPAAAAAAIASDFSRSAPATPETSVVAERIAATAPAPSTPAPGPLGAAAETISAAPAPVRSEASPAVSDVAPATIAAVGPPSPISAAASSTSIPREVEAARAAAPSPQAVAVAAATPRAASGAATAQPSRLAPATASRPPSRPPDVPGPASGQSARPATGADTRPAPASDGVAPRSVGAAPPIATAARLTPVEVPTAPQPSADSRRTASIAPSSGQEVAALGSEAGAAPGGLAGDRGAALRDFVRRYDDDGCFLAVASQVSSGTFAVSGFSRDEAAWLAFNRALDGDTGVRLATRSRQVSAAQCAALGFARRQADYPDFKARMALASDRVENGAEIRGVIEGSEGRDVALLLVDDEGLVQDATRLLKPRSTGGFEFETPLTLTAGPVDTVQLFVALVGDRSAALAPADRVAAKQYFAGLTETLKRQGEKLDVAIAAFSVDVIAPAAP